MLNCLNSCHTREAFLQRSHSLQNMPDNRIEYVATCIPSQATLSLATLSHHLERHGAAIILNMHKDNEAAWRLHSAIESALWKRCGSAEGYF